jgi:hypothetical protein
VFAEFDSGRQLGDFKVGDEVMVFFAKGVARATVHSTSGTARMKFDQVMVHVDKSNSRQVAVLPSSLVILDDSSLDQYVAAEYDDE